MQDGLWKHVIEQLFPDFVHFFLPALAEQVDFSQYDFLDKEFETLFPESKKGRRHVDKLAKVLLKDGQEQWVLIHTEIQGYHDQAFERRMFTYFSRIFDKYDQKIAVIAVFTDERPGWKPDRFEYRFDQTGLSYYYPVYKILEQDEIVLKNNNNPFSQVVLAALYALRSKRKGDAFRLQFKTELTQLLFQRGFQKAKIEAVFHFLDSLLHIKDPLLQEQFFEEATQMATTEEQVEIIGDFQRVAMRRGRQEGKLEGKWETAGKMKAKGFDNALIAELTGLPLSEIEALTPDS